MPAAPPLSQPNECQRTAFLSSCATCTTTRCCNQHALPHCRCCPTRDSAPRSNHGLLEWHCTWTGRPTHASHTPTCTRAHRTHAHAHANHRTAHAAPPAYLLCAVHGWEVFRNCDGGEWGQKPRFGSPRAAAIAPQSPNPLARGPAPTTGLPRPLHVAVPNGPTICPLTTTRAGSILDQPPIICSSFKEYLPRCSQPESRCWQRPTTRPIDSLGSPNFVILEVRDFARFCGSKYVPSM